MRIIVGVIVGFVVATVVGAVLFSSSGSALAEGGFVLGGCVIGGVVAAKPG